jgi:hypothetical protein
MYQTANWPTLEAYDNNNPWLVNQACNALIKLDKHIVDFSNPQESQFEKGLNHFNDIFQRLKRRKMLKRHI